MGNQAIVVGGIVVGFFLIPSIAGAAPEVVNGILLLLIIGTLLLNSNKWLPYLSQFGIAIQQPAPSTSGSPNPAHGR